MFFRFISAALRKIKFLLKANVAKRVRLIFARVAHAIVTQNWLFVSMVCKITLVTVNRASRGTENIVKVWPFLIDTALLGPKPIWNFIKNFIYLWFAQRKNWMFLKFLKVSFFIQCIKKQSITLQNFNIQTCFSQFLWFFSLNFWF